MKCIKCGVNDRCYVVKSGIRKGKVQSYCSKCNKDNVLKRQKSLKQKCIDYSGGKCQICGYNKCNSALEFHHKDPSQKDMQFSKFGRTSWDKNKEKIITELNKCILLCANCHREVHANISKYDSNE